MAKFREFYVPPGAGSNFLASKCMWASDIKSHQHKSNDVSTNEFFYHREKVNNTTIEETLFSEDFTNEDLISETKEIKSILLELESNIPGHYSMSLYFSKDFVQPLLIILKIYGEKTGRIILSHSRTNLLTLYMILLCLKWQIKTHLVICKYY